MLSKYIFYVAENDYKRPCRFLYRLQSPSIVWGMKPDEVKALVMLSEGTVTQKMIDKDSEMFEMMKLSARFKMATGPYLITTEDFEVGFDDLDAIIKFKRSRGELDEWLKKARI